MRVLGFIMLHYGKDYLDMAIKPLAEVCEKVIILYSRNPTHNYAEIAPIEGRWELKEIADKYSNVFWVDIYDCRKESDHIGQIFNFTEGYDVLVRADADEVWNVNDLRRAIVEVYNTPYRQFGINGFVHLWKTDEYRVSHNVYGEECDYFRPVRLWHLREKNVSKEPEIKAEIIHYGYAISPELMRYKLKIHGHKNEFREGWLDMWENWQPQDKQGHFHPTSEQIWHKIVRHERTD